MTDSLIVAMNINQMINKKLALEWLQKLFEIDAIPIQRFYEARNRLES